MEIKIIKSRKRRKTVSARLVKGAIRVNAPENFPEEKLKEVVKKLTARLMKRKEKMELKAKIPLHIVAARLNREHFAGEIKIESIEYSTRQSRVFGNCNYKTRTIRISHHVAGMPDWVRDYVVVHEMAHILEPNHSPSFWELVYRYKLTERARGFLIAQGFHVEEETDIENGVL
jgi:predicted metal-dependent hydrolase